VQELNIATRKQAWYAARGIAAEMLGPRELAAAEPLLRADLAGALRVPGDARVYPPKVAAQWLQGADIISGELVDLDGHSLRLADGRRLWAGLIVLCAGLASQRWLPPGWLLPKKGQLAITQSYPDQVRHQLVELGYLKKAHLADQDSVSFNVQPRPNGQLLIGSSRQPGRGDTALDPALLGQMLAVASAYLPSLPDMTLLRCWTGLRPASRDGLPLIGRHPAHARVWLATGHEGLGITSALATAELIAELSLARPPSALDARPYDPARLS
jgi:D-hydroxyproline dehydrogenase subunit beta